MATMRRWGTPLAVVGVVAACLGLGWGAGRITLPPAPEAPTVFASSLSIFDEPADPEFRADLFTDDHLADSNSRYLGSIGGVELFGVIGTVGPDSAGAIGPVVCMEARDMFDNAYGSCTSLDSFSRVGLAVTGQIHSGEVPVTYRWGPTGPPGVLSCDPQAWPDTCP